MLIIDNHNKVNKDLMFRKNWNIVFKIVQAGAQRRGINSNITKAQAGINKSINNHPFCT